MPAQPKDGRFKKIFARSIFALLLGWLFYSFFEPAYHAVAIRHKAQLQAFPEIIVSILPTSKHPYNTQEHIEDFISSDIDAFKVAVQATKDASYVLYKATRLDNHTDSQGSVASKYIKDLNCVYYQTAPSSTLYKLASLDEALARVNGRKKIFIDVINDEYFAGESAQGLASIIQKHQAFDYVVVESTNPFFLYALRSYDPRIVIQYDFITSNHKKYLGLSYDFTHIPWVYQWSWLQKQMIRLIQPDILGAHYTVERDLLDVLLKKNFPIIIWDVNTNEMIKSFLSLGVMSVAVNKAVEGEQNAVVVQYPSSVSDFKEYLAHVRKIKSKVNILANAQESPNTHAVNLSLSRFAHIFYESETKVLRAESGATFAQIQAYLSQFGRALELYPYNSEMTVYQGVIENLNGIGLGRKFLSNAVLEMEVLLSNGEIIRCNRKENTELFESLLGGMGTIGIILNVSFATMDNLYLSTQLSYQEHAPPAVFWYRGDEHSVIHFEEIQTKAYGIVEPRAVQLETIKINPIARYLLESSRVYQDASTDKWNATLHDISSIFDPNPVSFNQIGLLSVYPTAKLKSGVEMRESRFIIPIAEKNSFFEKLQAITKEYPSMEVVNLFASYVQKEDVSLIKFAKNSGLEVTLITKVRDNSNDLSLYSKMIADIESFVMQAKGSVHLQNLQHESAHILEAYPELKDMKKIKLKYEPESFITNKYATLLQ